VALPFDALFAAESRAAIEWGLNVKIRAGWCCEEPGCGEIRRPLLEAHHVVPLSVDPHNPYGRDRKGKCLCMYHHAERHKDKPTVAQRILARLGVVLWRKDNRITF
jgi:hypothetical protein